MPRKLFSQILTDVQEAPEDLKVDILRNNYTPMLVGLLRGAFDPALEFDVEIPSYRVNKEVDGYSSNNLSVETKRLYIFLKTTTNIGPQRKKTLLAQILESIDPSDGPCLIDVINKDLVKWGITRELVDQAFPGLIPGTAVAITDEAKTETATK